MTGGGTACPMVKLKFGVQDDVLLIPFTAWVVIAEVLPAWFESPPYTAVKLWEPMERVATVKVATPPVTSSDPRVAEPSRNVTLPVAVDGDTVAVSITLWPPEDGFVEEVSVVV